MQYLSVYFLTPILVIVPASVHCDVPSPREEVRDRRRDRWDSTVP